MQTRADQTGDDMYVLNGECKAHVVVVSAGDVAEGLGDESFSHAHRAENDDVPMRLEKAQAHELR